MAVARKASSQLTEAELRLMKIVWAKGSGTVGDIAAAATADSPLAYSTVLTMLRILESKGYLTHRKEGRAFVYQPAVAKDEASTGAVRHLLDRFFNNSAEQLMAHLLREEKLSKRELARLKHLIAGQK